MFSGGLRSFRMEHSCGAAAKTLQQIQESCDDSGESDEDCSLSSEESSEESEEEFSDSAEDVCEENEENIAPARKKARSQPTLSWKTERDDDVAPPPLRFLPAREPGVQLSSGDNHTPLDLFKLFFSEEAVETLCRNTNKQAARNVAGGVKYKWTDLGPEEFYRYVGLTFYMAMIKLDQITDYWRKNSIFTIPFPTQVMSRERYRFISWNIHMSDPDEDPANDAKKGTPEYSRLFQVKPLMSTIQSACNSHYHPRRNLAVDNRMSDRLTRLGFKMIVLVDSSNGYTVDFALSTIKNVYKDQELLYECVMSLINKRYLGSGYHVYMDSLFTSPKLFKDLIACKIGACGMYRESIRDCPHDADNALTRTSPRGKYRWIRDGSLLFVKWMDKHEVSVCSTIHRAFTGDTVQRKVKSKKLVYTTQSIPCPSPVMEYNKVIGGVGLSNQLIQYYTAQHKTLKWYRKLFFYFLDIAATNSYILHKELNQDSRTYKAFMEELTTQLCGVPQKTVVKKASGVHVPVPGTEIVLDRKMRASDGRKTCVYCRKYRGTQTKTPWKCKECDVYLCLQPDRNCFYAWHPDQE